MTDPDQGDDPREQETRDLRDALFGRDEPEATEPDEPAGPGPNYVPNEGNTPRAKDDSDAATVRALFGYDH